jgi:hypothetical protein
MPSGQEAEMKWFFILTLLSALTFGASSARTPQSATAKKMMLRGWLSDEGCAPGHVSSGKYTGTNPDCSKDCVAKGKKIVFIDPEKKRILSIANQDAARQNVGDYVEVSGDVNSEKKVLHIETLKMLERGRAMCEVPEKGKKR